MSKSVLIVDDSQLTLEIISFTVLSAGYRVIRAQGGLEALEILNHTPVDLMVVDIVMPDMDGYTLIRKIRENDAFRATPIIVVTTQSEAKYKQKGFEAGANLYMVKPVHPRELVSQIQLLVGDS
ncbi:two-component system, chemotaxis family, response regulator CheY [Desulfocicer vacuolatum DSM 3385]|uniref:Two-component system, chemotaxis family, response regulator CheY n=1 Tax=Desulfocicer vacuolatum DSM 3385 TaxID=1121400 RepID=A0A1W2BEK1_9BACT|nr:response regulator [Desulfocicer vacuolatum]SMC71254.1 two-component system, chemotaxis family, response regulator CheY [Desulfocicer vacuolatum DSM 3385]